MIAVYYKTKKTLKEAIGTILRCQETSMLGIPELIPHTPVPFVGPSAYERKFYGTVIVDENGIILKVS